MKKRLFTLSFALLYAFFLSSLFCSTVSAMIILPQTEEIYSLGEKIDFDITIIENEDFEGLIKLDLMCGEEKNAFFTSPIEVIKNEEKKINIPSFALNKAGNCKIIVSFEDSGGNIKDSSETSEFLISQIINITLELNKQHFKPSEELRLEGEARKENGEKVEGIAVLKINKEEHEAMVKNGKFIFEIMLWKGIKSGEHEIEVEVTDNEGNSGKEKRKIYLSAIPTNLEIYTNNNAFVPEDKIIAFAVLTDQNGEKIDKSISLAIYDSWGKERLRKMVVNESIEYFLEQDAVPGDWWVYAFSENIRIRRFIYVEEVSKIDVELAGDKLTIKNIGNVIYQKPISITFSKNNRSITEIKELSLGAGKEIGFELTASGMHDLHIESEDFEKRFADVPLTGGTIGVRPFSASISRKIAIIIAFFMIVLLMFIKLKKAKREIKTKKFEVNRDKI